MGLFERSLEIAPFDIVHTRPRSLSCTFSEIYSKVLIENRQFELTPPLFGTHVGGDAVGISPRFLASEN